MKITEALNFIKSELLPVSGESAQSEAELILEHVFNCSRSDLYLSKKNTVTDDIQKKINTIVSRCKLHEPLPYIFNKTYFHSMEFYVDPSVLIPRPDTEILVETILENEKNKDCFFIDIGTGSGAIAAILLKKNRFWKSIGSDISINALRIAKRNCPRDVYFLNADMFAAFKPLHCFDFIVCNPPYITKSEMQDLDLSVKNFEPEIALLGGEDGLDFYRIIAKNAGHFLKPHGRLYCEIGFAQAKQVTEIFKSAGLKDIKILPDLAGRPRVVKCNIQ
jgi:release factor glutamine methyltransferase